MRVGILGPLQVVAGGRTVEVGGARLRALLIRLALDAGRMVSVESLAEALWPDERPADPSNALQTLVSRLRRALPETPGTDGAVGAGGGADAGGGSGPGGGVDAGGPVLRSAPGAYGLALPPEAVDSVRFESLARAGRQALRDGDAALAARHLREALGLWRGEPLADAAGAPFAAAAAARLSELRLAATEDRVEAELAAPSGGARPAAELVAELEALTAAHALRERPRTLLVRALHADGRAAEALRAYEDFRRRLADELGADPGEELQAAHLAALRGEHSPPRSRAARPSGNLLAALTSFIGREEERARLTKQLSEGRLVTLVGPGGAGKTRLAGAFAAGSTGDFPDGVWLVELAPVTDPADVPHAVIRAFGLREVSLPDAPATARDATSRIAAALADAEALLVLDNCEHLIDAAARLVTDLLGRCPKLRVLATSREPLRVSGEALSPVPPLGLPAPAAAAAEVMASPAVRLFAERAAAARPDFAVTAGNAAAVAEICRRLDGLPLAIELAAARLRALPVEALAAQLDDRFSVLTGGSRTALPRHQTLRAAVAWSWDLLDERERHLAERLAVFPGTITPESAEHVAAPASLAAPAAVPAPTAPGTISSPAVRDLLAALVDKSLLQVADGAEGRPVAYRTLDTIRSYGLERLAEHGDVARVRAAHAAYFLALAETAAPHLKGPGQLPWIRVLDAERDNLLAALHVAGETGDADTTVRLGAALGLYWMLRGNHIEAASRLQAALGALDDRPPAAGPQEAWTLAVASYLFNSMLSGGHLRIPGAVERLWAQTRGTAQRRHASSALIEPILALTAGDPAQGLAAVDRQLPHPDPWIRAMLRLLRSFLHGNNSDMREMRRDLVAAVESFRASGERWGLATSLAHLAYTRTSLGEPDGTVAALEESVRLLRELGAADGAILERVWLAGIRAQTGDVERARAELLEIVEPGARGTLPAESRAYARLSLGDLARYDGDLDAAARHYAAADADLRRAPVDLPLMRAMLGSARGHLAVAGGDLATARQQLTEALALAAEFPDMPLVAVIGVGVARLAWARGAAPAAEVLGAAAALRGAPDALNRDVADLAQTLRATLGDPAYQSAYQRGQTLDRSSALALLEREAKRT